MKKLLSIEFKKIFSYSAFWIFVSLYTALFVLVFFAVAGFKLQGPPGMPSLISYYTFPDIWHTITYIAGWFNLLLGVLIVILITNEFTFRTVRQNIIDGWSVNEFLSAKIVLLVFLAVCTTVFVFIVGMIYGLFSTPSIITPTIIFGQISFVLAYFVQTLAYLCFALFMGTLFKKAGMGIIFFLLYSKIVEPLSGLALPSYIYDYMPFHTISSLIEFPWLKSLGLAVRNSPLGIHFFFAILYSAGFIAATWLLLKKRDN
jgi:ABC-2 type transport system permease protein